MLSLKQLLYSLTSLMLVGTAEAAIVNLADTVGTVSAFSSANNGTSASQAIDGIGIGGAAHPAIWHTANELNPFLTVDLGAVYNLGDDAPAGNPDVTLSNRSDCCGTRLTGLRFEVFGSGGTVGAPLYSVDFDPAGALTYSLELPALQGQFFRLTKLNNPDPGNNDNRSINLAEIQVFGDNVPVPEPASIALLSIGAVAVSRAARRRKV